MNDIVKTLFEQIGGNKTMVMLGAYNICYDKSGLYFFIKGCKSYNYIKIKYNSLDLYNISFMKYSKSKLNFTKECVFNNIYGEDLKKLIRENTKLELVLF
jgi:hypothetical protein